MSREREEPLQRMCASKAEMEQETAEEEEKFYRGSCRIILVHMHTLGETGGCRRDAFLTNGQRTKECQTHSLTGYSHEETVIEHANPCLDVEESKNKEHSRPFSWKLFWMDRSRRRGWMRPLFG